MIHSDTALARALRVMAYQVIMAVIVLLTDKSVVQSIIDHYPWLAGVATLTAPFLSLLYNVLRKDVPNV